jgi:L-aminopeptidase/D-esterase-like protein
MLNRKATKAFALEVAKGQYGLIERIGDDLLDYLEKAAEQAMKKAIGTAVAQHKRGKKTLNAPLLPGGVK